MEELKKLDAEGKEKVDQNLAILEELQREVAHWRSRTALAISEWAERNEGLASERAGKPHAEAVLGRKHLHMAADV